MARTKELNRPKNSKDVTNKKESKKTPTNKIKPLTN
jgi:hypothetical protein